MEVKDFLLSLGLFSGAEATRIIDGPEDFEVSEGNTTTVVRGADLSLLNLLNTENSILLPNDSNNPLANETLLF